MILNQSLLTGEKIELSEVPRILVSHGIELTDQEQEGLVKTLPLDGESLDASCKAVSFISMTFLIVPKN